MFKYLLAQTEIFAHFLSGGPGQGHKPDKKECAAALAAAAPMLSCGPARRTDLPPHLPPACAAASARRRLATQ